MRHPLEIKNEEVFNIANDLYVKQIKRRMNHDNQSCEYFIELPVAAQPVTDYYPYGADDMTFSTLIYMTDSLATPSFKAYVDGEAHSIKLLEQFISTVDGVQIQLDYSEQSLIDLQNFVDHYVEIIQIPKDEVEIKYDLLNKIRELEEPSDLLTEWSHEGYNKFAIDNIATKEISMLWCSILYYIGVYMTKMVSEQTGIKVSQCKVRGSDHYNYPVICNDKFRFVVFEAPLKSTREKLIEKKLDVQTFIDKYHEYLYYFND